MAKVTGLDQAKQRIELIGGARGKAMVMKVSRALELGAQLIQQEARVSLTTGAVSGKSHQPSAPGSAPNNDSGTLANNIDLEQRGPLQWRVRSHAPYAAIQEFGGTINHPGGTPYFMRDGLAVFVSKQGQGAFHHLPVTKPHMITLPERPYMRPAAARKRGEVIDMVRQAVNSALTDAGR